MASIFESYKKQYDNKEDKEAYKKAVYYIESSNDDTVLVGIDVKVLPLEDGNSVVTWFDTIKDRAMTATEIRDEDSFFAFKRADEEGGQFYYFQPMTLDIYKDKVKDKLSNGGDFNDVKDLIAAFNETLNDA